MNWLIIIFWLLVTTISGSAGALFLKRAMNSIEKLSAKAIFTSPWVYLGTFLYILSAVTNIVLFFYVDYSIGFPMTSLTYVWTVFFSYWVFKERITLLKVLGILLIIGGVIVIAL